MACSVEVRRVSTRATFLGAAQPAVVRGSTTGQEANSTAGEQAHARASAKCHGGSTAGHQLRQLFFVDDGLFGLVALGVAGGCELDDGLGADVEDGVALGLGAFVVAAVRFTSAQRPVVLL